MVGALPESDQAGTINGRRRCSLQPEADAWLAWELADTNEADFQLTSIGEHAAPPCSTAADEALAWQLQQEEQDAADAALACGQQQDMETTADATVASRLQEEARAAAKETCKRRLQQEVQAAVDAALASREQQRLVDADLALREQQRLASEELAWRLEQEQTAEQEALHAAAQARHAGSVQRLDELAPCQQRALEHVKQRAAALHAAALELLKQRVLGLSSDGKCFSEADLTALLAYVCTEAPVIIHLTEGTLSLLSRDGFYRNQFETGTSKGKLCGASRTGWEDAMFGGHYSHAQPAERVKYGCVNMTGDITGVPLAHQYGRLFMILKPCLRMRTTFTDQDSSKSDGDNLATCEFYAHVLKRYSDEELRTVLTVARSSERRIRGCAGKTFSAYKEAQIHGPVDIRRDVLALSVPGQSTAAATGLRAEVEKFQELSGCNVIWQGDLME